MKTPISGQESTDLNQVQSWLLENSFAIKIAKTEREIAKENYQFYLTQTKPTLSLSASLPNYIKTSLPITQPDGSISFQSIRQSNSSLSANASKILAKTGGTLFATSNLRRFDDFSFNIHQYNGVPFRIGIQQPLMAFNPWKFDSKIERIRLEESYKSFNVKVELALWQVTDLYFTILVAKQNLGIAQTNQKVNERLLDITQERLELGKVSEDEKLQLEIELSNARLAVSQAELQLTNSEAQLYSYIGLDQSQPNRNFSLPTKMNSINIDEKTLLESFKSFRPEILTYNREIIQSQANLSQAKSDFGFQAVLSASLGLARGATNVSDIYTDPFDEQQFNVSLNIPLLDWGKKKSAVSLAILQRENVQQIYKQNNRDLENQILQTFTQLKNLQKEIHLLEEIMNKSEQRFDISNQRYILGNIDITNLTIAQREKDQAKRNYINGLRSYWTGYYFLRSLTGFDIHSNSKITY